MPLGGLYATYHLLREPETAIDITVSSKKSLGTAEDMLKFWGQDFSHFQADVFGVWDRICGVTKSGKEKSQMSRRSFGSCWPFQEEISYSKHQFSEDISIFRVVVIIVDFRNFGKVVVSNLFYSHSDSCGNDPIWWAYFSNGLKPPTRRCHMRCFFNLSNFISKWKSVMFLLVIPIDVSWYPIRTRWGIYDIYIYTVYMICIYW